MIAHRRGGVATILFRGVPFCRSSTERRLPWQSQEGLCPPSVRHLNRRPPMHRALAMLALLLLAWGCTPASREDVNTGQALVELGDALSEIRQDQTVLLDRLDSLSAVVARQDTVIRTIANMAGVPVPR